MNKKRWGIFAIICVVFAIGLPIIISKMTLKGSTGLITIVLGILSVACIVYSLYLRRSHPSDKRIKRGILSGLIILGFLIVLVANGAISKFSVPINQLLSSPKVSKVEVKKTKNASKKMVESIGNEGFVLLKNQNNSLPLNSKKVSVFGSASVKPVYGGSGSGAGSESENVTLQEGLKNSGIQTDTQLTNFYKSHKLSTKKQNNFNLVGADYRLKEPTLNAKLLKQSRKYSDTALIVLARRGGEGGDLPKSMAKYGGDKNKSYLELTDQEKSMIETVKKQNFKKVIVIINSSNPMELGFLDDKSIDSAILIGGPGATGMNSLGKILSGKVNPSGRLVDTYAYNVKSSPAYKNSGNFTYANHAKGQKNAKYVDYSEGIYVGYRYYETRYVNNQNKMDETAYHDAVQYPFGYGLSYSKFTQTITSYQSDANNIRVKVNVKNTGKYTGKDVVQLYYTAPYHKNGIEKSYVDLGAYNKTKSLKPGESQTISFNIPVSNLASYDYKKNKAYVLESGEYQIKLMNNAHDVIEQRSYNVPKTIVYSGNNKRTGDKNAATNQFDSANGGLTYLSRSNWNATFPEGKNHKVASKKLLNDLYNTKVDNSDNKKISHGNYGLKLKDMRNLNYNDPKWNKYLSQFSDSQMKYLIGNSLFSTQSIPSQGVPGTVDTDGPAGLNNILRGVNGVQYSSATVMGATWNQKLIKKAGKTLGKELKANGNVGLYAPAVNIHRTPFSGRNFEYYSEDGLLAGKTAAAFVKGARKEGIITYVKHFALNDQETNRDQGVSVWANEQAIREIYLKAFELPVKEGKTLAMMSSYNRIGGTWSGADKGLMTNVLRNEWGFKGMVVTDMNLYDYQDVDQGIRAGNDMMLSSFGKEPTKLSNNNTGKNAMRRATHNILYAIANSAAFKVKTAYPTWLLITGFVDLLLILLLSLGMIKVNTGKKIKK